MGKRSSDIRGRLISSASNQQRAISTISVRPYKVAFLIKEDTPSNELLKYIEYNTTTWGGIYGLMVPTDGRTLRDDWMRSLVHHDPDLILTSHELSEELLVKIFKLVQPFTIRTWSDEALNQENKSSDFYGCIPMAIPLIDLQERSQSTSRPTIAIPSISDDHPLCLFAAAQFGTYPESYRNYCRANFMNDLVTLEERDLSAYLKFISQLAQAQTPIQLTKLRLSYAKTIFAYSDFTLVFTGDNCAIDLCLFWNLRCNSSFLSKEAFIFPIRLLSRPINLRTFANWCNDTIKDTNHITIASATLGRQRLKRFADRLQPLIDPRIEFLDLWFTNFVTGDFRVIERDHSEELYLDSSEFRLKVPNLGFSKPIYNGQWIVDVEMEENRFESRGFLPPKYPLINHLLSGNPSQLQLAVDGYPTRLADGRISYRARRGTKFISGKIPTDSELLGALLRSQGLKFHQTDKCKYVQGIIRLAGGLKETSPFREDNVCQLFRKMSAGKVYSPKEMVSNLRPSSEAAAYSLISNLAQKRILLRGYKIQCPSCDLTRWYSTSEFCEAMQCAGCLSALQPPLEASQRYRLNELMARGIKQGSVPVLLTLLFLKRLCRRSFMALPGIEVNMAGGIDLDILASCDGNLVVAECKDLQQASDGSTPESIIDQLKRTIEVARRIGASTVFLAILAENVPKYIKNKQAVMSKKERESVSVQLITGKDLMRGFAEKKVKLGNGKSMMVPCNIDDYMPKRPERTKGWVKKPGNRTSTF